MAARRPRFRHSSRSIASPKAAIRRIRDLGKLSQAERENNPLSFSIRCATSILWGLWDGAFDKLHSVAGPVILDLHLTRSRSREKPPRGVRQAAPPISLRTWTLNSRSGPQPPFRSLSQDDPPAPRCSLPDRGSWSHRTGGPSLPYPFRYDARSRAVFSPQPRGGFRCLRTAGRKRI